MEKNFYQSVALKKNQHHCKPSVGKSMFSVLIGGSVDSVPFASCLFWLFPLVFWLVAADSILIFALPVLLPMLFGVMLIEEDDVAFVCG